MFKNKAALFLAALSLSNLAIADIIVNGNFEQPRVKNNGAYFFKKIPGWTSTLGDGIEIQRFGFASFNGYQHVELDGNNNSNMIQTVTTVPNVSYVLSFAYSPRPGMPINSNGVKVFFNDKLLGTVAKDGMNLAETDFDQYFFIVLPRTNNSTIEFRATGVSDGGGGYIDGVILEPQN